MYWINVNEKYEFEADRTQEGLFINGKNIVADAKELNESSWNIIKNLQAFNVEVIEFNRSEKKAIIKVNNITYNVIAKDRYDILLDKLGLSNLNAVKVSEVRAPMPGMVLKVFVTEGMDIKKDDNLFILEAMKMENIIKSPADATLNSILIKAGDKVEKNQVLMLF